MISDQNKHITQIKYNHLNLPYQITFDTGSILYTYDAVGTKLKKYVTTNASITNNSPTVSTTEYLGGFQYNNGLLQFISTPEGYVNATYIDNQYHYNYVYNYTDHLGNIRLSYTWDSDEQVVKTLEEHQYYPFGLEHKYYNNTRKMFEIKETEVVKPDGSIGKIIMPKIVQVANSGYQYQYNGKEWQEELGLNWYDYGARNYDASLGRFFSVDPKTETYHYQSPFVYADNNPILFIDINGEGVDNDYGIDKNGNIKLIKKTEDKFDRLYVAKSDEKGNAVLDEKGNAKKNGENHITVQNQYLLSNLSNVLNNNIDLGAKGTGSLSMSYASEDAKNDVFNIFKFASDNSKVEWSVAKIGLGESTSLYNIGTYHNTEKSPGAAESMDGLVLGVVHSHPNIQKFKFDNGKIDWKTSIESSMRSDAGNYKLSKVKYKDFVYFPETKGTYRIRMSTDGLQDVEAVKTNSFRF